jgi:prepilin peptidase CpaA
VAVAPELAGAALLVACVAAWTDARTRRIPNLVCLAGLMLGLVINAVRYGAEGLAVSAAGIGTGAGLLAPAYLLRLMGAGDVKLMAAVGALLGFPAVVMAVLASHVAGGVIAFAVALRAGVARQAVRATQDLAVSLATQVARPRGMLPPGTGRRVPFGVAVVVGTAFALWFGTGR